MAGKKTTVGIIIGVNMLLLGLFVYFGFISSEFGFLKKGIKNSTSSGGATPTKEVVFSSPKYAYLKTLLKPDKYLKIIQYPEEIGKSALGNKMSSYPRVSIYILGEFKEPLTSSMVEQIKRRGWTALENAEGKVVSVFYGIYQRIEDFNRLPFVKNTFVMEQFSAKGTYKLNLTMDGGDKYLNMKLTLPYSKEGRQLLERQVRMIREDEKLDIEGDVALLNLRVRKNYRTALVVDMEYKIDMDEFIGSNVKVVGNMTLGEYRRKIAGSPFNKVFLSTSDKIVFSDYIDNIAKEVGREDRTIEEIWGDITKRLNADIRYDYAKKHEFFGGQKVYNNIRDMYLTAAQLGNKRVGACPERSSLEVAILRRIGIPSRTATRIYHIYAEIYWPGDRWVSTSSLLREIPLVESSDQNQSYFVDWTPNYPIKIKWQGAMRPVVL